MRTGWVCLVVWLVGCSPPYHNDMVEQTMREQEVREQRRKEDDVKRAAFKKEADEPHRKARELIATTHVGDSFSDLINKAKLGGFKYVFRQIRSLETADTCSRMFDIGRIGLDSSINNDPDFAPDPLYILIVTRGDTIVAIDRGRIAPK